MTVVTAANIYRTVGSTARCAQVCKDPASRGHGRGPSVTTPLGGEGRSWALNCGGLPQSPQRATNLSSHPSTCPTEASIRGYRARSRRGSFGWEIQARFYVHVYFSGERVFALGTSWSQSRSRRGASGHSPLCLCWLTCRMRRGQETGGLPDFLHLHYPLLQVSLRNI